MRHYDELMVWLVRLIMYAISFSSPAPPLTSENILKVVKNAQNWRTLGEHIYAYTYYMYKQSTLDDIQHEHVSSEAYLRAIIEDCLSGKSRYTMTWRVVIWSLYKSSESQLAESIRSFAESGTCFGHFNLILLCSSNLTSTIDDSAKEIAKLPVLEPAG